MRQARHWSCQPLKITQGVFDKRVVNENTKNEDTKKSNGGEQPGGGVDHGDRKSVV